MKTRRTGMSSILHSSVVMHSTPMATFHFPLDGVLRQRKLAEDQRQRDLAAVQAEMAALEAQLRAMDQEVQGTTADVRDNHLTGRLDLTYLAAHRRYTLAMQRK